MDPRVSSARPKSMGMRREVPMPIRDAPYCPLWDGYARAERLRYGAAGPVESYARNEPRTGRAKS